MDRALTNKPRRDELRVSVERYPRPHIAVAVGALVLFRDVFLLRVTERPDLITFDRLGGEVGEFNVLILDARRVNGYDVYWLPWSEWITVDPAAG